MDNLSSKDSTTLSPRVQDNSLDKSESKVKLPSLYAQDVIFKKAKENMDKLRKRNKVIRNIYSQSQNIHSKIPWNPQDQKFASIQLVDLSVKDNSPNKTLSDILASNKTISLLFDNNINHNGFKPILKYLTMPVILLANHSKSDE